MSERTLSQLLEQLRTMLPDLQARYGVQTLGVFGSYVRGNQHQGSDIDVLVEFDDRPLSLFDFIRLENELSDALGLKVDLVERRALRRHIGRRILSEVVSV
jgi:uncharacterized protein